VDATQYDGVFTALHGFKYRGRNGKHLREALLEKARQMHIRVAADSSGRFAVTPMIGPVLTQRAPRRDKQIRYNADDLPRIDKTKQYGAGPIVTAAMKVFALDSRVVSIDADLGTTSGLEAGVAVVDQNRALNVGVAEANMMNIGEAYAAACTSVSWICRRLMSSSCSICTSLAG
jgi:hypothetical protein